MKLEELNYVEYSDDSTGMDIHVEWNFSDKGSGYEVSVWDGEQYDAALNIGEYELGSGITKITKMSSLEEMFKGLEIIADTYLKALNSNVISLKEAFTLCSNLTEKDIQEKLKEDSEKETCSKLVCAHCGEEKAHLKTANGKNICQDCRETLYWKCVHCEKLFDDDHTHLTPKEAYCVNHIAVNEEGNYVTPKGKVYTEEEMRG
jgi:aspartate carbamoyltransferase regulatory subunit